MNTWTWQTLTNEIQGRHSINRIILEVCERRQIGIDAIMGKSRKTDIVSARVEIARRAAKNGYTMTDIGDSINRHHSTITHYLHHYQPKS